MTRTSDDLKRLEGAAKATGTGSRQPVDKGHFGIVIDKDGVWSHGGTPFPRIALAKLFATVLKRDGERYWLETPVEKGLIDVEDAPFIAVEMEEEGAGEALKIRFRDNLDQWTPLDDDHRLRLEDNPEAEGPRPYLHVRDGLEARLARSAYYHLADLAIEDEARGVIGVWSHGVFHELGPLEPE